MASVIHHSPALSTGVPGRPDVSYFSSKHKSQRRCITACAFAS